MKIVGVTATPARASCSAFVAHTAGSRVSQAFRSSEKYPTRLSGKSSVGQRRVKRAYSARMASDWAEHAKPRLSMCSIVRWPAAAAISGVTIFGRCPSTGVPRIRA